MAPLHDDDQLRELVSVRLSQGRERAMRCGDEGRLIAGSGCCCNCHDDDSSDRWRLRRRQQQSFALTHSLTLMR